MGISDPTPTSWPLTGLMRAWNTEAGPLRQGLSGELGRWSLREPPPGLRPLPPHFSLILGQSLRNVSDDPFPSARSPSLRWNRGGGSRVERLAGQEEWVQSGRAFSSQNRLSCGLVLIGETAPATPSMTSLKTRPLHTSSSRCVPFLFPHPSKPLQQLTAGTII